jgi:dTDP-glucose 4,6-dehydratase
MRKIVVTGGCGFIGSNLIHYWQKEHPDDFIYNVDRLSYAGSLENLEGLDRSRYEHLNLDLRTAGLVEKALAGIRPDGIIHLAAETHVDNSIASPRPFLDSNACGTFNLLEAVRMLENISEGASRKVRFVHVSTDEVFGDLPLDSFQQFHENSPCRPSSPYSASKAASDGFVRAYRRTFGLDAAVTNCSNNYGPRQHREKLIPTVIRNALEHRPIPIYGKGANVRDWLYVEDHCRALDRIYHCGNHDSYCVGADMERTNIDLVRQICSILDKTAKPPASGSFKDLITFVKDRPGHDARYAVDAGRLMRLGWSPAMELDEGLELTVKWYMERFGPPATL